MSTDDSDTLDRESNELLGRMQSFAQSVSASVHSRDEKIRALKGENLALRQRILELNKRIDFLLADGAPSTTSRRITVGDVSVKIDWSGKGSPHAGMWVVDEVPRTQPPPGSSKAEAMTVRVRRRMNGKVKGKPSFSLGSSASSEGNALRAAGASGAEIETSRMEVEENFWIASPPDARTERERYVAPPSKRQRSMSRLSPVDDTESTVLAVGSDAQPSVPAGVVQSSASPYTTSSALSSTTDPASQTHHSLSLPAGASEAVLVAQRSVPEVPIIPATGPVVPQINSAFVGVALAAHTAPAAPAAPVAYQQTLQPLVQVYGSGVHPIQQQQQQQPPPPPVLQQDQLASLFQSTAELSPQRARGSSGSSGSAPPVAALNATNPTFYVPSQSAHAGSTVTQQPVVRNLPSGIYPKPLDLSLIAQVAAGKPKPTAAAAPAPAPAPAARSFVLATKPPNTGTKPTVFAMNTANGPVAAVARVSQSKAHAANVSAPAYPANVVQYPILPVHHPAASMVPSVPMMPTLPAGGNAWNSWTGQPIAPQTSTGMPVRIVPGASLSMRKHVTTVTAVGTQPTTTTASSATNAVASVTTAVPVQRVVHMHAAMTSDRSTETAAPAVVQPSAAPSVTASVTGTATATTSTSTTAAANIPQSSASTATTATSSAPPVPAPTPAVVAATTTSSTSAQPQPTAPTPAVAVADKTINSAPAQPQPAAATAAAAATTTSNAAAQPQPTAAAPARTVAKSWHTIDDNRWRAEIRANMINQMLKNAPPNSDAAWRMERTSYLTSLEDLLYTKAESRLQYSRAVAETMKGPLV